MLFWVKGGRREKATGSKGGEERCLDAPNVPDSEQVGR